MTLILMRHGETDWNLEGRFNSRTDLPLSAAGLEHVNRVASGLANAGITRVCSSPARRAIETARIVAAGQPRVTGIDIVANLREMDFGDYEGCSRTQLQAQPATRERYAAWFDAAGTGVVPPGGESWDSAAQRAAQANELLLDPAVTTLAVGHGYLLRLMMVAALAQGPPQSIRQLRLDNAHLTGLVYAAGAWRVLFHNVERIPDAGDSRS